MLTRRRLHYARTRSSGLVSDKDNVLVQKRKAPHNDRRTGESLTDYHQSMSALWDRVQPNPSTIQKTFSKGFLQRASLVATKLVKAYDAGSTC
jgi:hypothetical protein